MTFALEEHHKDVKWLIQLSSWVKAELSRATGQRGMALS